MKIKSILILILVVLLLTLIVGCKNEANKSSDQFQQSTKQYANLKHGSTNYEGVNLRYGNIIDPDELEKLWQEYFYDTIGSIGNTDEFDSAMEIDPLHVAQFCKNKYVEEYGYENLELESENSTLRFLPLDTILGYAERYFKLTSLNVTGIIDAYYNSDKHSFIFAFPDERKRPAYNDSKSNIHLDVVTRNSDGTVTAVLVYRDNRQPSRIIAKMTYILKQHEDGSLYFVSGKCNYINNNLVAITGNYQRFDRITGFEGDMQYFTMIDEADGRLITLYTPYSEGKNAIMMLVDLNTMAIEKKLELNDEIASSDVSLKGENIIIRLKDSFIVVDKTLEQKERFTLPKAITDKINREPKYNKGIPDVLFGGYDVSIDMERYVYADEIGVKLFNIINNSEKLLSKTVSINNCELIDNSFHWDPRFVDNEQKVITTMTGYESSIGYTLCDLKNGTIKTYDIGSETSTSGLIRYDTGLMENNNFFLNEDGETGDYKTMYLNFKTGEIQELYFEDSGDMRIVMPDQRYIGRSFAAFITVKPDSNDNTNNIYYLNRLNLTTMQIEPKVITVKAARTYILGVLADGRIVFWYSLNPSEEGICITK